jgi:hypothetical protein
MLFPVDFATTVIHNNKFGFLNPQVSADSSRLLCERALKLESKEKQKDELRVNNNDALELLPDMRLSCQLTASQKPAGPKT